jgi:cytochrome b561
MQKDMKKSRHSIPGMIFHWGFLIIFIYGILKQVEDINQLSDISLLKFEIIFATLMLILLIIRYFYMSRTQVTSLPDDTSMFQKRAAKVVHLSLYINLAVIPITGLVIGILYWLGLKSGIFIEFTVGLHELSISTMYWLIAIHVSAAIFHRFKNDGVWSSMVPLLPEKKTSD